MLQQLIHDLTAAQIRVWVEDGNLKFSAPKGALTAALRNRLVENKPELIALLSQQQAQKAPDDSLDQLVASTDELAFAQQRLLFMADTFGASTAYNMPAVYDISGNIDIGRFQESLNRLLHLHSSLCLGFYKADGVFKAQKQQPTQWPLTHVHTTAEQLLAQQQAAIAHSFDLTTAPLAKAFLFSVSDTEHRLLLNLHHVISDGWSHQLLWQQLWQCYGDANAPLTAPKYEYGHFVAWQQHWLTTPDYERQKQFWTEYLHDAPPLIELPLDKPRPSQPTYRGTVHTFEIDAALTASLEALAQQSQSSLYILGLSALFYTLHKYTAQDDICIGTPVANRRNAAWEDILGFFANVVTLRQPLDRKASLTALTAQIRDNVLNTFEYQDFPFERVVEHLQPERALNYSPLFQVMFIFEQDKDAVQVEGLQLAERIEALGVSKFDLTLTLKKDGDKIGAGIEYASDIFEPATIQRLSGHYLNVLRQMLSHGEQSLERMSVLTADERQHLLHEFNYVPRDYPKDQPAYTAILQQADKTPEAIALSDGNTRWTYREVVEYSGKIAATLQQLGVKTGDRVGIYFERSNLMVASMIATWRVGAAYVPIDSQFPRKRQAMIAEDAQLSVILTHSDFAEATQALHDSVLFADHALAEATTAEPMSVAHSGDDLAYIMFTSGSTGRPKGVQVSQRNVQYLFTGVDERLAPSLAGSDSKQPVYRAMTSISFDISLIELFWTLGRGFYVIVEKDHFSALAQQSKQARLAQQQALENGERTDTAVSVDMELTEQNATHIQCTPSYAQLMLESETLRNSLAQVQGFYISGEALTPALAEQINALIPGQLYNLYGPTETTVWATAGVVEGNSTSIGTPLTNTRIYVLDALGEPVPLGVKGEMFIAGDGVTGGYWQRDDLTENAFFTDPFNGDGTQRMYRTGDMVRMLANGEIQFLHRCDNQVKVRGFRIELEEIQTVLDAQADVTKAAVTVHQGENKDARILAYVVPNPTADRDTLLAALNHAFKESLPDYMVPSHVFLLDAMPYTPNGKLDRKNLPTHVESTSRQLVPPANDTESKIADIWKQLLNLNNIGTQDNFFELGGHSLLLGRMQQMLKDAFAVEIDVVDLFKYPTIASLAVRFTTEQAGATTSKRERRHVNRDAVNQVRNQMRQRNRRGR